MNGTRTSALLDFGSGTSFASFAELWNYLVHNGWQSVRGRVSAGVRRSGGILLGSRAGHCVTWRCSATGSTKRSRLCCDQV